MFTDLLSRIRAHAPEGFSLPTARWEELERRHGEAQRHYHDLLHVAEVAERFEAVIETPGWQQPAEVFLALLCHDIVYEPGHSDNEARSAEIARLWAADVDLDADRVAHLIDLTARHGELDHATLDSDEQLLVDIDVAILAADEERFAAYEQGVAQEWDPVIGLRAWKIARWRWVEAILESDWIFASPHFRNQLEDAARENLAMSLPRLDPLA